MVVGEREGTGQSTPPTRWDCQDLRFSWRGPPTPLGEPVTPSPQNLALPGLGGLGTLGSSHRSLECGGGWGGWERECAPRRLGAAWGCLEGKNGDIVPLLGKFLSPVYKTQLSPPSHPPSLPLPGRLASTENQGWGDTPGTLLVQPGGQRPQGLGQGKDEGGGAGCTHLPLMA